MDIIASIEGVDNGILTNWSVYEDKIVISNKQGRKDVDMYSIEQIDYKPCTGILAGYLRLKLYGENVLESGTTWDIVNDSQAIVLTFRKTKNEEAKKIQEIVNSLIE